MLGYAVLVAVAALFAFHAPGRERGAAMWLVAAFSANWVLFQLSWTSIGPASLLYHAGMDIRSEDLWAFTDGLFGLLAMRLAARFWFGPALFGTAIAQELAHAWYRPFFGVFEPFWKPDFVTYSAALDAVFLAQIACFLLIGGQGVGDRFRGRRRDGNLLRAPVAASRETQARP